MFHPKDSIAYKVHQSRRWKVISRTERQRYPICCDPYRLHVGQARLVQSTHHIVAIEKAPALAYERDNTITLCNECHAFVELMYQRGIDTIDHLRECKRTLTPLDESKVSDHSMIPRAGGSGEPLPSPTERSGDVNTDPIGGVKCLNHSPWPPLGPSSLLCATKKGGALVCERLSDVQVYCCRMKTLRVTKCGSCKHL